MNNGHAPGFFVVFSFVNRPPVTKMRPAIRNKSSRQKVGFYFLTNVE
jgi:hypothetical protein